MNNVSKNHLLEQKFLKKLDNPNIKVVSFDIFDTLFFRKCFLPEDIFEIIGKHKYVKKYYDKANAFKNYRIYAEKNARNTHNIYQDITLDEIYNELAIPKKIKDRIKQLELDTEKKYLKINPDIEDLINLAYENNKKVILISDMYLNKGQLKYVCLDKLNNLERISEIYVSSEYKLTKAKGDLFTEVLEKEKINPDELLHIGDNKIADISIPHSLGINVLHYGYTLEQELQHEYEAIYISKNIKKGNHARKLAALRNPYIESPESFYYNFGASILGPVIFEFSHWLNNLSKKNQIDKCFFIMREGYIFNKYFKKLFPEKNTELIYASRNSTFPINLDLKNFSSAILGTQRAFTIKDLYSSLRLKIKEKNILKNKDKLLSEASSLKVGNKYLFDLITLDFIKRENEIVEVNSEQVKLIKNYFKSFNITANSLLVDFGAGGTIFNRIKRILDKNSIPRVNALFLINERGYTLQSNNHTLSFIENSKYSDIIFRGIEIFEILLNLNLATTVDYKKEKELMVPNLFMPSSVVTKKVKDSLIFGIDSFFQTAKDYALKPKSYSKILLSKLLARVITLPTVSEVNYLGGLEYDEGNNSDNLYKIINSKQLDLINNYGIEKFFFEYHSNRAKYRHSIPWFEGAISAINPEFLIDYHKGSNSNQLNSRVIEKILKKVDKSDVKKFYIYGAGDLFKELLPILLERDIKILGVIDTKAELEEFKVFDFRVTSLSKALAGKKEANIIIASGVFSDKIKENIKKFAKINNKFINTFSV